MVEAVPHSIYLRREHPRGPKARSSHLISATQTTAQIHWLATQAEESRFAELGSSIPLRRTLARSRCINIRCTTRHRRTPRHSDFTSIDECATGYFSGNKNCHLPTVFNYADPAPPQPMSGVPFAPPEQAQFEYFPGFRCYARSISTAMVTKTCRLQINGIMSRGGPHQGRIFFTAQTNLSFGALGDPRYTFNSQGKLYQNAWNWGWWSWGDDPTVCSPDYSWECRWYAYHSKSDEIQAGVDKDWWYGQTHAFDGAFWNGGNGDERPNETPGPVTYASLAHDVPTVRIDVDGDDIQDLFFCSTDGSTKLHASFFKGLLAGGFDTTEQALPELLKPDIGCGGITRYDVDGDNRTDLVVDNAFLSGFTDPADAKWRIIEGPSLRDVQKNLAVLADVNGDGLARLGQVQCRNGDFAERGGNRGQLHGGRTQTEPGASRPISFSPSMTPVISAPDVQVADVNGDRCEGPALR